MKTNVSASEVINIEEKKEEEEEEGEGEKASGK